MCGAKLPEAFAARLDELGDDAEAVREYGIEYATAQCRELLDAERPACIFTLQQEQGGVADSGQPRPRLTDDAA